MRIWLEKRAGSARLTGVRMRRIARNWRRHPGLNKPIAWLWLAVVATAGCAGDRYWGDWSSDRSRLASNDQANSPVDGHRAQASPTTPSATTQARADLPNALDSSPESIQAGDQDLTRVGVYLDVVRVEVPLGSVSESYKIWDHLDEQAFGADRIVTLKQNGLRVGVGRQEAWPPIKAVLDGIRDRVVYRKTANLDMAVISLDISEGPDDQNVFYFRRDGSMVGWSFPASRNLLLVMHELNPEDPNELTVKVVPEIRQNRRKLEWSRKGGRYVRVPVYHGRTLHELTIEITLPAGRFLVIGPGHEIEVEAVVGRALLTRQVEGKRYESIFFLTPRLIRNRPSAG